MINEKIATILYFSDGYVTKMGNNPKYTDSPIKNDGNPDSAINNFSKGTRVVAIIDPKTLKPVSVISEELTEISSPTETKTTKEKHEYIFEWK